MKLYRNTEAEKTILGMILKNPSVYFEMVSKGLTLNHFFVPDNKVLFGTMNKLAENDKQITFMSLGAVLTDKVDLIIDYESNAPAAENPEFYLAMLKRQYASLKVMEVISEISNNLANPHHDFNLIEFAYTKIDHLANEVEDGEPEFIKQFADKTMRDMEKVISDHADGVSGKMIKTPIRALNDKTSLMGGDFAVIGARPGHGKTAFALNIAMEAAKNDDLSLVFTLEMPKTQIHQRLLAMDCDISVRVMRTGNLSEFAQDKLMKSIKGTLDYRIAVDDDADQTFEKITSKIKIFKRKNPELKLVIIDYLTLMESVGQFKSVREMVNYFTRKLKILAKSLDIVIILLAQLNRDSSKRSSPLPVLSDLKESGSIEQDADAVFLLYHEGDDVEKKELADDEAIIILAKNRHGPLCKVVSGFKKPSGKYFNKG
jgi:replicative DNA helicase